MELQSESAIMQQSNIYTVMLHDNDSSTSCAHQLIGENIHGCSLSKDTESPLFSFACAMAERPEIVALRLSLVGPAMPIGKARMSVKHRGAEAERDETVLLLSPHPEPGPQM